MNEDYYALWIPVASTLLGVVVGAAINYLLGNYREQRKAHKVGERRKVATYRQLKGLLDITLSKSSPSSARFSEEDLRRFIQILADNHDVLDDSTLDTWDARRILVREGLDTMIDIGNFYNDVVNVHYERLKKSNPYHDLA